jgi:hypothetical protein
MKYGRVDVTGPEQCPEEGRLPGKTHISSWSNIVNRAFFFAFLVL